MKLLLKACRIIDPVDDYQGLQDIMVIDGRIKEISPEIAGEADRVINAGGCHVFPGFIDMHTHLREPGYEKKETVRTGTMAAAKGGYTAVCCMPNTKPAIDRPERLQELERIIEKDAVIKVYPIAAITEEQGSMKLTDMDELKAMGAIAFSDDGRPVLSASLLRKALQEARAQGHLIIEHCEELSLAEGGAINEGEMSRQLGIKGIPGLSEELNVQRDIQIAAETGAGIHIAHVSTAKAADIIRQAKKAGIRATCEVTPHHIDLTEAIIREGFTDCKVNPPLREEHDRAALVAALDDGTIDVIATDHAPHHEDDKGQDFYKAAFGISGIETAFSVCYTRLTADGPMSLKALAAKMSYNPARLLSLEAGRIKVGMPADLAVADLEKTVIIEKDALVSKGRNTPFHGRQYKGEIVYTIVNGKVVYENSIQNDK